MGEAHLLETGRTAGAGGDVDVAAAGRPPLAVAGRHLPALDGLRAVAVGGVLAFHLGARWAPGGFLGVDLFFVLSGFLITSLVVEEWAVHGSVRLGAFWGRRARRLLPALLAMLVVLATFVALMSRFGPPGFAASVDLSGLRGDALAALAYVANWHAIAAHQSYFAQFASPSPLAHTWSLAIEEQFYLVWPPVLVGLLVLWSRRRRRHRPGVPHAPGAAGGTQSWRGWGLALCGAGVAVSALLMAWLYHPGVDPSRAYYGTGTRMSDLLIGAGVAMVSAARPQPGPAARRLLHAAGLVGAAVLVVAGATAGTGGGEPRAVMFSGGFVACGAAAAAVVADVRQFRPGPLGRALSLPPLRAVGRISYGVYLWHWPVFVCCDPQTTGLSGATLDAARLGLTFLLASASYVVVEQPVRRRRWRGWTRAAIGPAAALATAAAVVVATVPAVAVAAAPATEAAAAAASVAPPGSPVPGGGGVVGSLRLPTAGSGRPLRVTVLGDSVAAAAEPAIAAALGATGEVRVSNAAVDGFGLTTDPIWRSSLPLVVSSHRAQLVVATWSWDDACVPGATTLLLHRADPVCALERPAAYRATLAAAVRRMLGAGAAGIAFLEFPATGPVGPPSALTRREDALRAAGERAWDRAARAMAAAFPGRVAYLPVGASLLLHGAYTSWLPPVHDPGAPASAWVRVRTEDDVHLCPAGAARYADAVLADLAPALGLRPARPWASGRWTAAAVYDTPPGACPADHPATRAPPAATAQHPAGPPGR